MEGWRFHVTFPGFLPKNCAFQRTIFNPVRHMLPLGFQILSGAKGCQTWRNKFFLISDFLEKLCLVVFRKKSRFELIIYMFYTYTTCINTIQGGPLPVFFHGVSHDRISVGDCSSFRIMGSQVPDKFGGNAASRGTGCGWDWDIYIDTLDHGNLRYPPQCQPPQEISP